MAKLFSKAALSDVAGLSGGYAFKSSDYVDSGHFILRSTNIQDDGSINRNSPVYLNDRDVDTYARFALKPRDTLFVMVGASLGKIGFVRESDLPALLNQNMWRIRATSNYDARFLYYAFREAAKDNLGMASGSARDFVRRDDYRNLLVYAPPLHEQRAIASVLGALDDKIELNRKMSATLEAMGRAIFTSWFVDFDPVRAKVEGRSIGLAPEIAALFPDSFETSKSGRIPKGWRFTAISEIAELIKGKSYKSADLRESNTALVTLKSFARGGGYRQDGLKPYVGDYKISQVVKPGDLVVACTDVTQAAEIVGRPAIVLPTDSYQTLVASLDLLIAKPNIKAGSITVPFLYCLLQTDRFVDHAYAHTTGTTVLHLSSQALPSFGFAMPIDSIAKVFRDVAEPLFDRALTANKEVLSLSRFRDALLPKLISGEIRVSEGERILEKSA